MNNHGRQVSVYAVDRDNRRHLLGTVGAFRSKELQIPAELTVGAGIVQLKVYPILDHPGLGVTAYEPDGIKTRGLAVGPDQLVVLYLDPDLRRSRIGIATG